MREALTFFIDSMLYKAHHDNFLVSPKFLNDLSEKKIKELNIDSILRQKDIMFMTKQYTKYKEMRLNDYINEKYDSIITLNKPNKDQFYYVISPPLFSRDKKYLLFYAKAFFKIKKKYRWDDMFFLFKKDKKLWKLIGYPDIERLQNKHHK